MKKSISILTAIIAITLVSVTAFAGMHPTKLPAATASINGNVVDLQSGETLAGVAILVEGTDTKVYTDFDGNFSIEGLEPGKYNLVLSMISYKSSLVENLELQANEQEEINIKLDNNR
ncbi:hypothetical protein SDC9_21843 [bioreactor metagenome]|jgi:hypothetical protein|uniref:TonB-dependent receptor SusC n=1 Tax=bioreactor metagenome TaxID=1076179 RepID=A0A644UAU1_9ZZZZ|nr:carboxypeptidase-like regulatory domain-containing protein [Lentimicrobium sp.]MEA5111514.1 carboxypeptidase-like regulatory domain-containing protein [Lentimicrobium sp.]